MRAEWGPRPRVDTICFVLERLSPLRQWFINAVLVVRIEAFTRASYFMRILLRRWLFIDYRRKCIADNHEFQRVFSLDRYEGGIIFFSYTLSRYLYPMLQTMSRLSSRSQANVACTSLSLETAQPPKRIVAATEATKGHANASQERVCALNLYTVSSPQLTRRFPFASTASWSTEAKYWQSIHNISLFFAVNIMNSYY